MSGCHDINEDARVYEKNNKILLMGNLMWEKVCFFLI